MYVCVIVWYVPESFLYKFCWDREPCLLSASASLTPASPGMTVKCSHSSAALACLKDGQSSFTSTQRVAPSLAMSTDAAEERDSRPAQRDELAHSCVLPGGEFYLPRTLPHLLRLRRTPDRSAPEIRRQRRRRHGGGGGGGGGGGTWSGCAASLARGHPGGLVTVPGGPGPWDGHCGL